MKLQHEMLQKYQLNVWWKGGGCRQKHYTRDLASIEANVVTNICLIFSNIIAALNPRRQTGVDKIMNNPKSKWELSLSIHYVMFSKFKLTTSLPSGWVRITPVEPC